MHECGHWPQSSIMLYCCALEYSQRQMKPAYFGNGRMTSLVVLTPLEEKCQHQTKDTHTHTHTHTLVLHSSPSEDMCLTDTNIFSWSKQVSNERRESWEPIHATHNCIKVWLLRCWNCMLPSSVGSLKTIPINCISGEGWDETVLQTAW
jgi:hypothetical protein